VVAGVSGAPRGEATPRLLDLFCGAGGAAVGYHRAGFEVVGVDIKPQPNYPFHFQKFDALKILDYPDFLESFDAIHASPPCQAYSMAANNGSGKDSPKLIAPTRDLLIQTGLPYVIENVEKARPYMIEPALICGGALGLGIKALDADNPRHRLFETNWPLMVPPCAHRRGRTIGVYGNGTNRWHRELYGRNLTAAEKNEAMEIDWMKRGALEQAIPPAYTELVGSQLMAQVKSKATA
jgi:DNA (cytosine-5)-methyltransferase 1